MHELAPDKSKSGKQWSDVAGRRRSSHIRQIKSQPIPVIKNCYELKYNDYECGLDTNHFMAVQWKENVNSKRKNQTRRDIKLQLQRTATQEA